MCVVFDYNNVRNNFNTPQLPYPYPNYPQTYSSFQQPNGRDELGQSKVPDLVQETQVSSSTTPQSAWDVFVDTILPSPPPRRVTNNKAVYVAPEDQKVIQPVLKNPYLTKLQRELLPPPAPLVAEFDDVAQNNVLLNTVE